MSPFDERGLGDALPQLVGQPAPSPSPTPSRYRWSWRGVSFDFYRLCEILKLSNDAQKHALKKVIRAGQSVKPITQDIDEAISALQRWKEMVIEDAEISKPGQEGKYP